MASYRWLLASSLTGEILAELPLTSAQYTFTLNEPGAFRGSLPLELPDPLARILTDDIWFSGDPQHDLLALYVERDKEIVWGGLLWADQAEYASEGGTLEITGEDWHSWTRRQVLTETLTFTQIDQAFIAKALLDWAQGRFGGSAGIDTGQVEATGRLRDRTYFGYERKSIGEAIEELAAVIDGFAFRYVSEIDGDRIVTRFLIDYPPARNTSHVFTLNEQLISARIQTDRTQLATRVHGIGAGEGDLAVRSSVTDEGLIGGRLWLDAVDPHTDVILRDTLEDYGAERLKRGSAPIVIPDLTVRADLPPTVGTYRTGDIVHAVGGVGWHHFTGGYRTTEITVGTDDVGTESVSLKLAPEGVFSPEGAQVGRSIQPVSIPSEESWGTPELVVDEAVIFFDDFTDPEKYPGNRGLDPAKWFVHNHGPQVNAEKQEYRPSAITVQDSLLVITATQGGQTGAGDYTSGLVCTAERFHYQFGKVEIRLRAPGSAGKTQGLWPSLFMLGRGSADDFGGSVPGFPGGRQNVPGWPTSVPGDEKDEIDVWEWPGFSVFSYHVNRHWNTVGGSSQGGRGADRSTSPLDMTQTFQVYGMVWTPTYLAFEHNGVEFHRLTTAQTAIPQWPHFLILNFALGGQFSGGVGGSVEFPSRYEIDWIKVTPLEAPKKVASLVDAFQPPQGIWTATGPGGAVATVNGGVQITTGPTYPGLRTTSRTWDLTGSSVYTEVTQVPNVGNGTTQAWLTLTLNHTAGQAPAGEVRIGYSGGQLTCQYQLNSAYTTVAAIPYSAAAHRFWSLSESAGTVTFATSPDGDDFTVRGQVARTALGFGVTALDVEIVSGHHGAETVPGSARFEGVNTVSGPIAPSGMPDETNTGTSGALTPSGPVTVTTPGTTIQNLDITGKLIINAANVTVRNCKITATGVSPARVVEVNSTGFLIEDFEIDGGGTSINGIGFGNYTARRGNVHGCSDGLKLGNNTTVEDCCVHDLNVAGGVHSDGMQCDGGASNITVRRNHIDNQNTQTSCVLIGADINGPITNVLVEGNWFFGKTGFAIRAGSSPPFSATGIVIRNNRFGPVGATGFAFGTHSFSPPTSGIDFTGNVFDATGVAIPDVHLP